MPNLGLTSRFGDVMMAVAFTDMILFGLIGMPVALLTHSEWPLVTLAPLGLIFVWVLVIALIDIWRETLR